MLTEWVETGMLRTFISTRFNADVVSTSPCDDSLRNEIWILYILQVCPPVRKLFTVVLVGVSIIH